MKPVVLIVAVTKGDWAIGSRGDMLFHLRDDLRRFKSLTMGNALVMGRKTAESLPGGKPLPGRLNLVVSRSGLSLEEALAKAQEHPEGDTVYVIGGGEIYAQTLPLADRVELTLIDAPEHPEADTFFPALDPAEWAVTAEEPGEGEPPHTFLTYRRL